MHRRVAPLLALIAIGCEVLVPLDQYTGGKEPSGASKGGHGGTLAPEGGGAGLEGWVGEAGSNEGGQPEGGAGSGGTGLAGHSSGGTSAQAGTDPGTGGDAGTSGAGGKGGTAGTGGGGTTAGGDASGGVDASGGGGVGNTSGMGGKAGRAAGGDAGTGGGGTGGQNGGSSGTAGMRGGMGGAGMAGAAGCQANLSTDPQHCGTCSTVCGAGIDCEGGKCISSPCVGICDTWTTLPTASDGFRKDDIGNMDVCFENIGYDTAVIPPKRPSIICWNFAAGRTLQVNDVTLACVTEPGTELTMPLRGGGYCIHASAGENAFAGLKLPIPGQVGP